MERYPINPEACFATGKPLRYVRIDFYVRLRRHRLRLIECLFKPSLQGFKVHVVNHLGIQPCFLGGSTEKPVIK